MSLDGPAFEFGMSVISRREDEILTWITYSIALLLKAVRYLLRLFRNEPVDVPGWQ
jgi:hypothetical protein